MTTKIMQVQAMQAQLEELRNQRAAYQNGDPSEAAQLDEAIQQLELRLINLQSEISPNTWLVARHKAQEEAARRQDVHREFLTGKLRRR